jgi:hypothetical protein
MFNIDNALNVYLGSQELRDYYKKNIKKIEALKTTNSYDKIRSMCTRGSELKCVLGEATQNYKSFIYSNNSSAVLKNSFLPIGKIGVSYEGKFCASNLHAFLAENAITAVDLFPTPLPSEYYSDTGLKSILTSANGLGGEQLNYLEGKVDEIITLAKDIESVKIITVSRYRKENVISMSMEFQRILRDKLTGTGISLEMLPGDLSDDYGFLDEKKFKEFKSY